MAKKVRLISGLILFSFLTCHLLNLSFGLNSLAALDESRRWFLIFWATDIGIALLLGSMAVHLMFGLFALYKRNTLKMNKTDTVQLVLGLLIFPLLFGHLLGAVIGPMMTGSYQSYFSILTLFWVLDPLLGLKQIIVTVVTWIHGCMGLVIWMRIQTWWPRVAGFVYPLVIAIPLLAMLGMVEAGKEVIALNKNPELANKAMSMLAPNDTINNTLANVMRIALWLYIGVLAAVLLARYLRLAKGRATVGVTYADGIRLEAARGLTLLEISRMNAKPHASLCGGKGRCGTCRVRIIEGMDLLSEIARIEQRTLQKVKADPDTRLACQAVTISGEIQIERLLPPYIEPKDRHRAHTMPMDPADGDAITGAAK